MKLQKLEGLRQSLDKNIYPYPEPEWNAENINRKSDSTTLKQCGWCKYCGGGSCRYNCSITTSCTLLHDYGLGSNTYWDTPCLLQFLSKEDMNQIIQRKQWNIKNHLKSIEQLKHEIKTIEEMEFPVKPPLPDNRFHDYQEGEVVWVFNDERKKWIRGIVVPGYRSHDGCVSYILDDIPESQLNQQGPRGCGVSVPGILTDEEYQYFIKHLEDFKIWLHLSDKEYNGEREPIQDMYKALKEAKK